MFKTEGLQGFSIAKMFKSKFTKNSFSGINKECKLWKIVFSFQNF